MKKIFFLSITVLVCVQFGYSQQEPHYTQNQFNSNLLLNPAYAGSLPNGTLSFRYRHQWTGFTGAPRTFNFIGDMSVAKNKLGIGLTFNADIIGIEKIYRPDINLAYHIDFKKKGKLAIGIKLGVTVLTTDFNKLSGVNTADPLYTGKTIEILPFVGAGLLYYTDKSYIGFSIPTLYSIEKSSVRSRIQKMHYYLYGGHSFVFKNGLELRPAIMARFQPQAIPQFDFALDLWYKTIIGFGVSYRTLDAFSVMIKTNYKSIYVSYAYDITTSKLNRFSYGTHEIFLGYRFCSKSTKVVEKTGNIRNF